MTKGSICVALLCACAFLQGLSARPGKWLASEKLGWKLGVQAWTFNRFTFFEAIEKAHAAGLKYIEAFPGQKIGGELGDARMGPDLPISSLARIKIKLEKEGVKLIAYGVTGISKNEAEARKLFDFAKIMGIEVLTAEPEPALFPMIDKLTAEYGIKVALHNHPKPSRYWNPDIILKAVKGYSNRIGACADTGHWVRSGLDPLECLKKLEGRVVSFHLKDLNEKKRSAHDVPWGTGISDIRGIMAEMKRQNFKGPVSIEYEYNWENSLDDVKKCAEYFEKVAWELLKK